MIYLGIAVACCIGLIYPYILYPLLLRMLPQRPVSVADTATLPARYGLVFAAYNEEAALPEKIANVRNIKALLPDLRVIAYSDCSTDGTVALLQDASDIITLINGAGRAGKATGMRCMVEALDVDVIIFTDANVILDPTSARRLLQYFSIPDIGCVAGTLNYSNPHVTSTAQVGSMYWRLEETIKQLESATGSIMGADGSIFAARRQLYPIVPPNLLDDMIVSMTPLFHGKRVISARDVVAYEKSATSSKEEFRRKRRIACRSFRTYAYLAPKIAGLGLIDRFKFTSHKLLRWFGVIPLFLSVVFGFLGTVQLLGFGIASLAVAFGLILLIFALFIRLPLASSTAEIVLSICATGVGVLEAIRGHNYTVWQPAKSRN